MNRIDTYRGRTVSRFASNWNAAARQLYLAAGKPLVKHASLTVAISAALLYLIGVIRTAGVLRIEDIPLTRGLTIVPLQDYLLRGLSVVAQPQILFGFGFILFGSTVLIASAETQREFLEEKAKEEKGSAEIDIPNKEDVFQSMRWAAGLGVVFILIPVLVFPVAEWLPMLPATLLAVFCLVQLHRWSSTSTQDSPPVGYVMGLLAALAMAWALKAYFDPPPLETATITELDGKQWKARLLLGTGDTLYVLGQRDPQTNHRAIRGIPIASVQSVEVSDGPTRNFKTVPELLGIPLVRFWEDENGELHIESTP